MPSPAAAVAPSPELLAFAKRQLRASTTHIRSDERRSETRQAFAAPAVLQEVDSDLQPLDVPFPAATRDLTLVGVGLVCEEPVPLHKIYTVQFSVDDHQSCLQTEALWCRPMGPYHYVGFRVLKVLT